MRKLLIVPITLILAGPAYAYCSTSDALAGRCNSTAEVEEQLQKEQMLIMQNEILRMQHDIRELQSKQEMYDHH